MAQRTTVAAPLNVRWTIGDVRPAGFAALRLSIRGLFALLGDGPRYCVVVNTISLEVAKRRTGPVPPQIAWLPAPAEPAPWLRASLDHGLCDGTAWKLMPPQLSTATRELALDNDVILWALPEALRAWLADPSPQASLLAADVTRAHGRFDEISGARPLNTGLRGTPAGYGFAAALAATLARHPGPLRSELDEQGLQIAALLATTVVRVVGTSDVAICSPFPPHTRTLGKAGAHFVGLNTQSLPWTVRGRPAAEIRIEHWQSLAPAVEQRIADLEAGVPCT